MTWEVGKTYPMRNGGEFYVLEIDGPDGMIFGRSLAPGWTKWVAGERQASGEHSGSPALDIMPPTPLVVVVSDAMMSEYYAANSHRPGIAAAITSWIAGHPHMLRAWLEGPK